MYLKFKICVLTDSLTEINLNEKFIEKLRENSGKRHSGNAACTTSSTCSITRMTVHYLVVLDNERS